MCSVCKKNQHYLKQYTKKKTKLLLLVCLSKKIIGNV